MVCVDSYGASTINIGSIGVNTPVSSSDVLLATLGLWFAKYGFLSSHSVPYYFEWITYGLLD